MATAKLTEITQRVELDALDSEILEVVSAEGVPFKELTRRFSQYSYAKLRYRMQSLERWGLIRTALKRGQVYLFTIGG